MLNTIWERYFLRETLKVFLFFLFGFYGLYVLIDYSNHSHSFQNYKFSFLDIGSFYAYEFITRMDVLVPFAILIACIKTMSSLNRNNELIALMASGIKLKRLLLPFVVLGLLLTTLLYFNTEILQPNALKYRKHLDQTRTKVKQKKKNRTAIQQLALGDETSLIFQDYDEGSDVFYDVYWVRSIDDIYRMEYLLPTEIPVGRGIEHLQRDKDGVLAVTETYKEKLFPEMHFNQKQLLDSVTPPSALSLSSLKDKLPARGQMLSEKEAQTLTTFYYKLAMPWLCLLAVIAAAPFCTRFSRTLPLFFIYALSLFGLFAFYLVMDAAVVLAERQIIQPFLAIWVPFALFFGVFGWRYMRTT